MRVGALCVLGFHGNLWNVLPLLQCSATITPLGMEKNVSVPKATLVTSVKTSGNTFS